MVLLQICQNALLYGMAKLKHCMNAWLIFCINNKGQGMPWEAQIVTATEQLAV